MNLSAKSQKDLSIIIVNYRSWKVLEICLDSFDKHTPKLNYEIIVVDNNSKDGKIKKFSQKYPKVCFIENSDNNGFAHGCNLGVTYSCGNFLLFLNPDTILTNKMAIDKMFKFAKNNSNYGIISCRKVNSKGTPEKEVAFDSPWLTVGWIRSIYKTIYKSEIQKQFSSDDHTILEPSWVAGSVVLIQKKIFDQIEGWSEESFWMYYEDMDLCKKVKDIGKDIALLCNTEVTHIHGGSSRINPKTTAITKSEVITSRHVYAHKYTNGHSRGLLHFAIITETLSLQLISAILCLPLFWKAKSRAVFLTLQATLNYYIHALFNLSWLSRRLNTNPYLTEK